MDVLGGTSNALAYLLVDNCKYGSSDSMARRPRQTFGPHLLVNTFRSKRLFLPR